MTEERDEWLEARMQYRREAQPLPDAIAEEIRQALVKVRPLYIDILENEDYADLAMDLAKVLYKPIYDE